MTLRSARLAQRRLQRHWRRRKLQLPDWFTDWWERVVRRRDRYMSDEWLLQQLENEEATDGY